jgi:hypothetical protein
MKKRGTSKGFSQLSGSSSVSGLHDQGCGLFQEVNPISYRSGPVGSTLCKKIVHIKILQKISTGWKISGKFFLKQYQLYLEKA